MQLYSSSCLSQADIALLTIQLLERSRRLAISSTQDFATKRDS